jgi:hypothetical protein
MNLVKLPCPYKRTSEIYQVVFPRIYSLLRGTYHKNANEKVTDNINLTSYKVADDAPNTVPRIAAKREMSTVRDYLTHIQKFFK